MSPIIFISILSKNEFAFGNSLLKAIKEEFPKVTIFDFDNHSENLVVNYAIDFLKQTDQPIIIIDCNSEESSISLRPFFNQLVKYKKEVKILVKGENESLNKFIKPFSKNLLKLIDDGGIINELLKISAGQNI